MEKKSAEAYLDKLLNSVSGNKEDDGMSEVREALAKLAEEAVDDDKEEYDEFFKSLIQEADEIESQIREDKPKRKKLKKKRGISKSEADFLQEFEDELEDDKYRDYVSRYEKQFLNQTEDISIDIDDMPEQEFSSYAEIKHEEVLPSSDAPSMSISDDFDVDALIGGASEIMGAIDGKAIAGPAPAAMDVFATVKEEEPVEPEEPKEPDPFEELAMQMDFLNGVPEDGADAPVSNADADAFSDFFGSDGLLSATESASIGASESIDLGNLGEADLMSLLAGEDGLSDIGDMLSQPESMGVSGADLDAFASFAQKEMAAQSSASETSEAAPVKAKKGKGGLFDKLSSILFGDDTEEEGEEEGFSFSFKKKGAPNAKDLADENADILASMDEEEKGGKKKKEKKKKEKKPKKEKAPKAPKPPKPKKEKKPKEVDNTPPLPKGPVTMIWVMAASLFALVMLGTNLIHYSSAMSSAKGYFNNGQYANAYKELVGLEIKEGDLELYYQISVLATVDSQLDQYELFLEYDRHVDALDSLICAAGRCEINASDAVAYMCEGQMDILKKEVTNELRNRYGMSYDDALAMYRIKSRDKYTLAVNAKIKELGLK